MCKIGAFMTLVTPSGGIKNTKPGNIENNWVESTSLHLFFSTVALVFALGGFPWRNVGSL